MATMLSTTKMGKKSSGEKKKRKSDAISSLPMPSDENNYNKKKLKAAAVVKSNDDHNNHQTSMTTTLGFTDLHYDLVLHKILSFVDTRTIKGIVTKDKNFSRHYHMEDVYCGFHGTKLPEKGATLGSVLNKIKKDGKDPNVFLDKLCHRVDIQSAEDYDTRINIPILDHDKEYSPYLNMMKRCSRCEQNAKDKEMADTGCLHCSGCDEYIKWNEFVRCDCCFERNDFCRHCEETVYCEVCHSRFCFPNCRDQVGTCDTCEMYVCGDCEWTGPSEVDDSDSNSYYYDYCDRYNEYHRCDPYYSRTFCSKECCKLERRDNMWF